MIITLPMKKILTTTLLLAGALMAQAEKTETITIKILETSDVHGCFLSYDFANQREQRGGLSRVCTYVEEQRATLGENLILLENGDILQGQPIAAYYNYVATDQENIAASITNFMRYDVQGFGNHDIETGHAVYDKWVSENNAPTLGANIVKTGFSSESPEGVYTTPYYIITRAGARIAVLGMLTPAIPNWLNESIWSGLRFDEMVASARFWVNYIQENEQPDMIIGLFHSGRMGGITTDDYCENASQAVAEQVPGFDAIFFGHDHTTFCDTVTGPTGKAVWLLNPANNAQNVSELTITLERNKQGAIVNKTLSGTLIDVRALPFNPAFEERFANAAKEVKAYTQRVIGTLGTTLYTRDCFFGSNPFIDMIQDIQLELTGADISFSAPLGYNTIIEAGDVTVADMFNIYRYENLLCTIMLSGQEIKDYLEMSYAMWTNQMVTPNDHIMNVSEKQEGDRVKTRFNYPTFNFDSALGIDYVVDVTRPTGEKITILQMSNGAPFDENKMYKVAMNSYRANNGGELLTRGAKIKKEDIAARIIWQSDRDLRHYLMEYIESQGTITPVAHGNWLFIPVQWTTDAIARDKALLFN